MGDFLMGILQVIYCGHLTSSPHVDTYACNYVPLPFPKYNEILIDNSKFFYATCICHPC